MMFKHLPMILTASLIFFLTGCNRETPTSPEGSTTKAPTTAGTHTHDDGTVHDDHGGAASADHGHGGSVIELGTTTIGPFAVRASRDQGDIEPGGDAPIDVWLTGGDHSKVTAVRFWIGTQAGDESVKARADIENPAEPNHWHTHAEVPSPLPTGSKLWVEIEVDGQKQVGSFDLNA